MLPAFLLPEIVTREDGAGAEITLKTSQGPVVLTLGITRILEQESLEVSVWGKPDGEGWRELAEFPQKSYCGVYTLPLNLSPGIGRIKVQWKMSRWLHREPPPLFGFYVFAERGQARRHAGAA
jgi:hypothetical protein